MHLFGSYSILFLYRRFVVAAQPNYSIISINKGLPSSEVYAIGKDKKRYIWFTSDHAVAGHNGKKFNTYTFTGRLPDNTIVRIGEDKKGRIWLATLRNELYHRQNDSLYRTPASDILHKKVSPMEVIDEAYVDSTDHMWISTAKKIVFLTLERYRYHCRHYFNDRNILILKIDTDASFIII